MIEVLRWREFAAGRPYHAALVPVPDVRHDPAQHSHADFHELVYVVAGHGLHRLPAGAAQELAPGDLILVRPHDAHDFVPIDSIGFRFINVAFASERWHAFLDYAAVGAANAWDRAPTAVHVRNAPDSVRLAMTAALADYHKPPSWLDLISLWTAVVPVLESALDVRDERPPWLTSACSAMYAEQNLRAGLTRLRALAAVSDGHLTRVMQVQVGCTPVEFVSRVRLDHAANLLATTVEPVSVIAERCGFASHAYFCGRFRARFGVVPTHYRREARRAVVP